jgi:hypothetical protein
LTGDSARWTRIERCGFARPNRGAGTRPGPDVDSIGTALSQSPFRQTRVEPRVVSTCAGERVMLRRSTGVKRTSRETTRPGRVHTDSEAVTNERDRIQCSLASMEATWCRSEQDDTESSSAGDVRVRQEALPAKVRKLTLPNKKNTWKGSNVCRVCVRVLGPSYDRVFAQTVASRRRWPEPVSAGKGESSVVVTPDPVAAEGTLTCKNTEIDPPVTIYVLPQLR